MAADARCVGRRERHVVGHGPDRFDLAPPDAVGQIEHATRLAPGRIDVEQDGRDPGLAERRIQLRGEAGVAGQAGFGFQPDGAAHQRAVDRDDGDRPLSRRRRAGWRVSPRVQRDRRGRCAAEHGQDDVEFRAMDRQRHANRRAAR